MEKVTFGPEVAKQGSAMLPSTRSLQRCPLDEPAPPARRWPRREDAFPLAYHLATTGTLAAVGFPSWRIGVLALAAVVQQLELVVCRGRDTRQCVNAGSEQIAWWVALSQVGLFVTTWASAAVTGGVESPLLVTFAAAYFAAVAPVGDRLATRIILGATALGVGALALLPSAVTGPDLEGPARGLLQALGVLGVGALLVPVHLQVRKRRDEIIRARREVAADALARAEEFEQMGARLAHELKNPLTGVKALVQLGLRSPAEAASRERLEVVEREVSRMQEILQNYLGFARPLGPVRRRRVELGPLVSDTLVVLSGRADDAHIRLYAKGDAAADADPGPLKQALMNLVSNAIEATPPGGEVAVEVRSAGDQAEIVVRDTGRGMPAETLRHIGTPFFTTREDGTGLGVVLARTAIAQHGGSLRYESEVGRGTQVKVTLPRVAAEGLDAARAARG